MASVVFGGGISRMVGSHAGNTFAANRGGAYVKQKVKGVNPRSSLQLQRRTNLGHLSKYYSNTLTAPQRQSWATFAATYPVVNRLGQTTFLSAQQMFTKLNANALASGGTIQALPPVGTAVGTPTSASGVLVHGAGGSIDLTNVVSAPTGSDVVLWWVSPPLSPGRAFVSSLLRRMPTPVAVNSSTPVTVDWIDIFGSLPSGAGNLLIFRAQVVNTSTGIASAMLQGSAVFS